MRRGMGKGKGKGYKNLIGRDKKVHSDSAKGRKQPQRIQLKTSLRQRKKETKINPNIRNVSEEDYVIIGELLSDQVEQLKEIDNKIWVKLGVSSGTELESKKDDYYKLVDESVSKNINQFNYLYLEGQNYHSLNEALEKTGKFATTKQSIDEINKLGEQ